MATATRQMRLTEAHVARIRCEDNSEEGPPAGLTEATDADYESFVSDILAAEPDAAEVWVFAYGSLVWKPACAFIEMRTGLLRGWHRSFCLGWNTRWRGSVGNPGLMLALDRGGQCSGVLYRLPPGAIEANLELLCRREMSHKPSSFPPRWVSVASPEGPVRAITFCIDRKSGRYVSGLGEDQVADVLARAVGSRGSMAEYLFQTVRHLEEMGIHDRHLWRLQELVALRIERQSPRDWAPVSGPRGSTGSSAGA
jgi:glutathione-specific gamma-glutamylcyclotransferase